MGLVIPIFRGDPIFKSVAWFFVKNLKFIFTLISEIKIHEKKFLDSEKIHFWTPIFSPFRQPRQYLTPTAWELIKWYLSRVQLFGGELRKCNDFTIHSEENCTGHFYQRILVSSELNLDDKYSEPRQLWVPRVYANPRNFDFDTMSNAILTLFEVLSLKGWIEVRDVMINRIQEKSFPCSYFSGN